MLWVTDKKTLGLVHQSGFVNMDPEELISKVDLLNYIIKEHGFITGYAFDKHIFGLNVAIDNLNWSRKITDELKVAVVDEKKGKITMVEIS